MDFFWENKVHVYTFAHSTKMFAIFFITVATALAQPTMTDIAKTCTNNAAVVEGHLHMTSITGAQQQQECSIDTGLVATPKGIFIELERYGGRHPDQTAWTNITFVGTPNVTVTINNNAIDVNGKITHLNTYSKLEKSMTLYAALEQKDIAVLFAPVNSQNYGKLHSLKHVSNGKIVIATETKTGMEQVLKYISFNHYNEKQTISFKTIHELERRVTELDRDITPKIDNILLRLDRHQQILNSKQHTLQQSQYKTIAIIITVGVVLAIVKYIKNKPKKYLD